jgi:dTDP-4-dehydrorhamnose 3,5-epimerase
VKIETTPLAGVLVVDLERRSDPRGAFMRVFCANELAQVLGGRHVVQSNHSSTVKVGTVRGMHFQHQPHAEMKLITCLHGSVWDVAVDLRAGSPTFLQWFAAELSSENPRLLVIPEGCAHGFQVLRPQSELLYFHTAPYTPEAEGGVRHDDPALDIPWPLPVSEVSQRDRAHLSIGPEFTGVIV